MTTPQHRRDAYGNPIQSLVDAEQELKYERAFNKQQRKLIFDELEKIYRILLRAKIVAVVNLRFMVKDGMIQTDFFTDVEVRHTGDKLPDDVYLHEFEESMMSRDVPDDIRGRLLEKRKKQRYGRHPNE